MDQIKEGVDFAHERGKKVYVTLNIIPHEDDLVGLEEYVTELYEIGIDAVIVSDQACFPSSGRRCRLEVHISTQASVTNAPPSTSGMSRVLGGLSWLGVVPGGD